MRICIGIGILLLATKSFAQDVDVIGGYTTPNGTGITGLWNSTGTTQLTSAVNITGASFTLSYQTNQSLSYPYPITYKRRYVDGSGNKIWPLTIYLNFNSSSWTSYSSATVALNIGNYIVTSNNSTHAYSVATNPLDYFKAPASSAFYANTSSSSGFSALTSYSSVNPRTFTLSQFTPTYTGSQTGYLTLYVVEGALSSGAGYPWDDTPSDTTVSNNGTTTTNFVGILWLFPRVGEAGYHNYFGLPQPTYPVGAV